MVEREMASVRLWKAREGSVLMRRVGCALSSGVNIGVGARAVVMPAVWVFPRHSRSFSMLLVVSMLVADLLCWLGNVWWRQISSYRVAVRLAGVVVTVWRLPF